jgi:hypothetical protein
MTDDEFRKLLSDYLDTTTPEMADVELDMMEGQRGFGADHALEDHGVRQEEIRQVSSKQGLSRTLFWGITRRGRALTVVAHDDTSEGVRRLTLITAFDETEEEWRRR